MGTGSATLGEPKFARATLQPSASREMNSAQKYILLLAMGNLALVLLFPPYDYVSMLLSDIPTFDGFYFVFSNEPHRIVNRSFLTLEVLVVARGGRDHSVG